MRSVETSCERGNESSGSVNGEEFLDQVSYYQIPMKDSAPWSQKL
jgi:hypothetical protein